MFEMVLAIGLAAWRVTAMLSRETGPFDVFVRFRRALGFQHDETGFPIAWPTHVFAQIIACPMCLSVWLAVAFYGVWRIEPIVVLVIAAMAVAALLEEWRQGLGRL